MKQIFINLPVDDVEKSMQFYIAIGFTVNPLFTDKHQKCLVCNDSIYIMLQTRAFANTYFKKEMIDARSSQMPSFTLPLNHIQEVDTMIEKALALGAIEPVPVIKEDFMYLRSIQDLDGYMWGIMFLDIEKFKALKNK